MAGEIKPLPDSEAIGILNLFFVLRERGAEKQDNPDFDS